MGFSKLSYINVHDTIKKLSLLIRGQKVFLSGELMIIHVRFTVYHARSQFPVHIWE